MGIHRRGTHVAEMIRSEIEQIEGDHIETGSVDITLYRDDLEVVGPRPIIGATELPPGGIDDMCVVIVDDVAFTGRTSDALNELSDWGRPGKMLLCVLIDRGGRELPIQPDITGRQMQMHEGQRVEVLVPELDGDLGVALIQTTSGGSLTNTVSPLGKDLIGLEKLSADQILQILDTAEPFKEISERRIKKVPVLRGKTIVNLFFEASTRTRVSFEFAEKG